MHVMHLVQVLMLNVYSGSVSYFQLQGHFHVCEHEVMGSSRKVFKFLLLPSFSTLLRVTYNIPWATLPASLLGSWSIPLCPLLICQSTR